MTGNGARSRELVIAEVTEWDGQGSGWLLAFETEDTE